MVKYLFLISIVLSSFHLFAQDSTVPKVDTTKARTIFYKKPVLRKKDSVASIIYFSPVKDSTAATFDSAWRSKSFFYSNHPYFSFTDPVKYSITVKTWQGKEAIFYSMIALLLFFALVKNNFYRYLQSLFKIYFRTTIQQRQVKDELIQNPLPSLLLTIFFGLSIGMFLALLFQYFGLGTQFNFWILFFYCVIGLAVIYAVKYLSLKLLGWIFQVSEAIDNYIFIVFTTNKIIGIFLLPFLLMLAFSYGYFHQAALSLSLVVIGGLLVYRFFLSYITIQKQVHISFFHFLLYLCAFEIVPLLLINKVLFRFLD